MEKNIFAKLIENNSKIIIGTVVSGFLLYNLGYAVGKLFFHLSKE